MIAEFFLVAVLHYGTINQQILVLDRIPTERACQTLAGQYASTVSDGMKFGCFTSYRPNII
jgi:hypothetical protein